MADLQSILAGAPVPDSVRADAWDAYHAATSADDLTNRISKMALPMNVKADLWDAKNLESRQPAIPAASRPQQPDFWGTLGSDFMGGIPHTLANVGRLTGIGQTQDSFNQAAHELKQQFGSALGNQADEFSQSITPQDRALADRNAKIRAGQFTGPLTPEERLQDSWRGITGTPPPLPTEPFPSGAVAAHMVSPYVTDAAMLGVGEGLSEVPWGKVGTVARGAAKGAGRGATEMVPVSHGFLPRMIGLPEVNLPAPLAYAMSGGSLGAGVGKIFGESGVGSALGGTVGAVAPIVRGALKGGREAAAEYAERGTHLPRPDRSDLLTMPGAGVPAYSSTITPEPGFIAREAGARPTVTRPSGNAPVILPRPSATVPWLDQLEPYSNSPIPNPSSYTAIPAGGPLVEPWKTGMIKMGDPLSNRPDYSDLVASPGAGIPPYQSSITPESGASVRSLSARPVVTRSPDLPPAPLPQPSTIVDWLGRPVTPETAPVPAPASFVSTSGSRLAEPWKPTVTVSVDTPGGIKKAQVPADAVTTPPPVTPHSARAVALTSGTPPAVSDVTAETPVLRGRAAPYVGTSKEKPFPVSWKTQSKLEPQPLAPTAVPFANPLESQVSAVSPKPALTAAPTALEDQLRASLPPEVAARVPAIGAPPPVPAQPSGILQNLIKTVTSSPDKNAEAIAEHAGNIGHELTTNKNATIAQHLLGQGIDAAKWDALPMEEKNAWVKRVNAAQKTRYKPFGADFGPGRYGRPAEEGIRQVSDALRVLGARSPE